MRRIGRFIYWILHRRQCNGFKFSIRQCWWTSGQCF